MEAVCKFDYTATDCDDLSFNKGDKIKIFGTKDDWYQAERNGKHGFVPKNFITLDIPSWYREDMSRQTAECVLMHKPTGAFIIRGSQSSPGNFSISVRHEENVQHFKVMQDVKGKYFLWSEKFSSLNELVAYYTSNSISKQSPVHLLSDQSHPSITMPTPAPRSQSSVAAPVLGPRPRNMINPGPSSRSLPQEIDLRKGRTQGRKKPQPCPGQVDILPPEEPTLLKVKALYDFEAEERDELAFYTGDIIDVIEQPESFWWKGRLRGQTGLFPCNYVSGL